MKVGMLLLTVLLLGQDRLEDTGATGHRTKSDPFSPSPPSRGRGRGPGKGRSNRGRTVLTEKQRTILTACFQHNPKPDALLKVRIHSLNVFQQNKF